MTIIHAKFKFNSKSSAKKKGNQYFYEKKRRKDFLVAVNEDFVYNDFALGVLTLNVTSFIL